MNFTGADLTNVDIDVQVDESKLGDEPKIVMFRKWLQRNKFSIVDLSS